MELVIATNNQHKVEEINKALKNRFTIFSLKEKGIFEEIPEDQDTLEGNALQKARYIYNKYGVDCFADDTGLEVSALGGQPGVFSARYAGAACNAEDNMSKLLEEMAVHQNREAQFRTVIALILKGTEYTFEGKVSGSILRQRQGTEGFGYDPIFQPEGYALSFAEIGMEQKNEISHRGRAIQKLVYFLESL